MEKILQQQSTMQDTLGQVLGIVRTLAAGSVVDQTTLPEGVNLPVTSVEEMIVLNEQLSEETTFAGLVNHLSVLGGQNRTDMCRRVMRHCMTNAVATLYNWYGKKQKQPFGKLRLAAAVQKAVMRSARCTSAEVELDCKEWFRTASDHEGGQKKGC